MTGPLGRELDPALAEALRGMEAAAKVVKDLNVREPIFLRRAANEVEKSGTPYARGQAAAYRIAADAVVDDFWK